ncbi:MAG: translesion error-prone DNA polymerase V autoproteolytic subunit [Bacteroidia bacterium]|nr:translesion error-prone DNA polymerase V autoproteolytic subunit [Bacteroidia bacterium]
MKINTQTLKFSVVEHQTPLELPFFQSKVSAGFPSPAEDYEEQKLDLNKKLVKNQSSTFFVTVQGHSMIDAGINDGDMLIVDRALHPSNNTIAVCVIDNEFTVKRISKTKEGFFLMPENKAYKPIKVTEDNNFEVWGVVSYVIKNTIKI